MLTRLASLTCTEGHAAPLLVPAHATAAGDQMLTAAMEHRRVCEADEVLVQVEVPK